MKRRKKEKKGGALAAFPCMHPIVLVQGGIPSTQLLLFCEPKVSPRND